MTENAEFTFSIHDNEAMISHWFLNSESAVKAVCETPEWKKDRKLVAKVTVNGIEMPFADLDKFLLEVYERYMKEIEARYAEPQKEVDRLLKLRLEGDAKPIIDKLWELQQSLKSVGDVLTPYWEKN